MKIFIIVLIITTIIASLYYYVFYRYLKSKFKGITNDSASNIRDSDTAYSLNNHSESQHLLSESDIINLESSINKKLPEFYSIFLMNYPKELVTLGAPYNTVSDLSLPNTPDRIVELNSLDFVPADILVIGEDGLGNLYYNILSDNNSVIYLFNHEAPEYHNSDESEIDWHASWDLKFQNLDEMMSFLKESLSYI